MRYTRRRRNRRSSFRWDREWRSSCSRRRDRCGRSSCIDNRCDCNHNCGGGGWPPFPWWLMCCCDHSQTCNGTIQVTSVNMSGTLLPGAVFGLYQGTTLVGTAVGNADGVATFSNVCPGVYNVSEVAPPAGYELNTTSQSVTVTSGATVGLVVTHTPVLTSGMANTGAYSYF